MQRLFRYQSAAWFGLSCWTCHRSACPVKNRLPHGGDLPPGIVPLAELELPGERQDSNLRIGLQSIRPIRRFESCSGDIGVALVSPGGQVSETMRQAVYVHAVAMVMVLVSVLAELPVASVT